MALSNQEFETAVINIESALMEKTGSMQEQMGNLIIDMGILRNFCILRIFKVSILLKPRNGPLTRAFYALRLSRFFFRHRITYLAFS